MGTSRRRRSGSRGPSIIDVAAAAGVSTQTVSRVLNDFPHVSPQARARVRAAVEQLGYRRNMAARSLASRRMFALGVVVTNAQLFGPSQALLAIEAAGRRAGYWCGVTMLHDYTQDAMATAIERFADQGVDGVVVVAPNEWTLAAAATASTRLPLVAVTAGPAAQAGVIGLDVDQRTGAQAAMRHLIEQGHRRIAHVAGPADEFHARVRAEIYDAAMRAAGLEPMPYAMGDWQPESGYAAGLAMACDPERPTAVFAANDQIAMGLIRALWEQGVRVPQDVSVVGFDNIAGSQFLIPPLTTVDQDFNTLGQACVQTLVALLDGQAVPTVQVAPTLVVRASTCPPN
ncbi:MAG: LacI family DNA-binding transcriptional regulator [Propionibacteriaceae bacterium]|nr:LacI family DNA-binding transcriptional regulator [Propionibacteriaceae bacterium]